jgi:amino-acid N-acetyltransferase
MINNEIAGTLGTETYGKIALLRLMAVDVKYRNNGIAHSLLQQIFKISKENKIHTLFLLTTTAQNYFLRHGFVIVERDHLPDVIKNTQEFQNICPVSAVCMKKEL